MINCIILDSYVDGVVNMKFEIAAITSMGMLHSNNCDSFNINGKILTTTQADKGYKAAGVLNAPIVLSCCSSTKVGSAYEASSILNEFIPVIHRSEENYKTVFLDYLENVKNSVILHGDGNIGLSVSLLYAFDDKIAIARLGKSRIYRFTDVYLTKLLENEVKDGKKINGGIDIIDNLSDNETFLLCSSGFFEAVSDSEISNALSLSENAKDAAKRLSDIAKSKNPKEDITLIIIKAVSEISSAVMPPILNSSELNVNTQDVSLESENSLQPEFSDENNEDESPIGLNEYILKNKIPIIFGAIILALLILFLTYYLTRNSYLDDNTEYSTEDTTFEITEIETEAVILSETSEMTEETIVDVEIETQLTTTRPAPIATIPRSTTPNTTILSTTSINTTEQTTEDESSTKPVEATESASDIQETASDETIKGTEAINQETSSTQQQETVVSTTELALD